MTSEASSSSISTQADEQTANYCKQHDTHYHPDSWCLFCEPPPEPEFPKTVTPDGKPAILVSEEHFDWIMRTGADTTKLGMRAGPISVGDTYEQFGSANCEENGL